MFNVSFDRVPYSGQVVKMGTPCYIIGITKEVRKQKNFSNIIDVVIKER